MSVLQPPAQDPNLSSFAAPLLDSFLGNTPNSSALVCTAAAVASVAAATTSTIPFDAASNSLFTLFDKLLQSLRTGNDDNNTHSIFISSRRLDAGLDDVITIQSLVEYRDLPTSVSIIAGIVNLMSLLGSLFIVFYRRTVVKNIPSHARRMQVIFWVAVSNAGFAFNNLMSIIFNPEDQPSCTAVSWFYIFFQTTTCTLVIMGTLRLCGVFLLKQPRTIDPKYNLLCPVIAATMPTPPAVAGQFVFDTCGHYCWFKVTDTETCHGRTAWAWAFYYFWILLFFTILFVLTITVLVKIVYSKSTTRATLNRLSKQNNSNVNSQSHAPLPLTTDDTAARALGNDDSGNVDHSLPSISTTTVGASGALLGVDRNEAHMSVLGMILSGDDGERSVQTQPPQSQERRHQPATAAVATTSTAYDYSERIAPADIFNNHNHNETNAQSQKTTRQQHSFSIFHPFRHSGSPKLSSQPLSGHQPQLSSSRSSLAEVPQPTTTSKAPFGAGSSAMVASDAPMANEIQSDATNPAKQGLPSQASEQFSSTFRSSVSTLTSIPSVAISPPQPKLNSDHGIEADDEDIVPLTSIATTSSLPQSSTLPTRSALLSDQSEGGDMDATGIYNNRGGSMASEATTLVAYGRHSVDHLPGGHNGYREGRSSLPVASFTTQDDIRRSNSHKSNLSVTSQHKSHHHHRHHTRYHHLHRPRSASMSSTQVLHPQPDGEIPHQPHHHHHYYQGSNHYNHYHSYPHHRRHHRKRKSASASSSNVPSPCADFSVNTPSTPLVLSASNLILSNNGSSANVHPTDTLMTEQGTRSRNSGPLLIDMSTEDRLRENEETRRRTREARIRRKEGSFLRAVLRQALYPLSICICGCVQIFVDLNVGSLVVSGNIADSTALIFTNFQGFLFFCVFWFDPAVVQTRQRYFHYLVWKYYVEFYFGMGMPIEGLIFEQQFLQKCRENEHWNPKLIALRNTPSFAWSRMLQSPRTSLSTQPVIDGSIVIIPAAGEATPAAVLGSTNALLIPDRRLSMYPEFPSSRRSSALSVSVAGGTSGSNSRRSSRMPSRPIEELDDGIFTSSDEDDDFGRDDRNDNVESYHGHVNNEGERRSSSTSYYSSSSSSLTSGLSKTSSSNKSTSFSSGGTRSRMSSIPNAIEEEGDAGPNVENQWAGAEHQQHYGQNFNRFSSTSHLHPQHRQHPTRMQSMNLIFGDELRFTSLSEDRVKAGNNDDLVMQQQVAPRERTKSSPALGDLSNFTDRVPASTSSALANKVENNISVAGDPLSAGLPGERAQSLPSQGPCDTLTITAVRASTVIPLAASVTDSDSSNSNNGGDSIGGPRILFSGKDPKRVVTMASERQPMHPLRIDTSLSRLTRRLSFSGASAMGGLSSGNGRETGSGSRPGDGNHHWSTSFPASTADIDFSQNLHGTRTLQYGLHHPLSQDFEVVQPEEEDDLDDMPSFIPPSNNNSSSHHGTPITPGVTTPTIIATPPFPPNPADDNLAIMPAAHLQLTTTGPAVRAPSLTILPSPLYLPPPESRDLPPLAPVLTRDQSPLSATLRRMSRAVTRAFGRTSQGSVNTETGYHYHNNVPAYNTMATLNLTASGSSPLPPPTEGGGGGTIATTTAATAINTPSAPNGARDSIPFRKPFSHPRLAYWMHLMIRFFLVPKVARLTKISRPDFSQKANLHRRQSFQHLTAGDWGSIYPDLVVLPVSGEDIDPSNNNINLAMRGSQSRQGQEEGEQPPPQLQPNERQTASSTLSSVSTSSFSSSSSVLSFQLSTAVEEDEAALAAVATREAEEPK